MKDWGLAGEKPSFIVVLSTFPHQHENHLRWPSFPASFDFICSSILVIWPNQSHIKEVAGIWKHLYGNSKMFRDIFNSLYIGFQKTFFHPILGMGGWGLTNFSDHRLGLHQRSLCRFRAFAKSSSNLLVHLLLQFEIVSNNAWPPSSRHFWSLLLSLLVIHLGPLWSSPSQCKSSGRERSSFTKSSWKTEAWRVWNLLL